MWIDWAIMCLMNGYDIGVDFKMIREYRSRRKLEGYYNDFMKHDIIDPNVHPWVAESWKTSKMNGVPNEKINTKNMLPPEKLQKLQQEHGEAIDYLKSLLEEEKEFFQSNNLSLLLVDSDCVVLKSFSVPYFQMTAGEIEGVRVGIEEVGTSSISIAYEHKAPFWLFGPEMWVKDCQGGDACSAPVIINGELRYILTLVAVTHDNQPMDSVIATMLTIKNALTLFLKQTEKLHAQERILDVSPFAVYHIMPQGEVEYANKLGLERLKGITVNKENGELINLNDVILNYKHTPIFRGFSGIPSYNKEITWLTKRKTYEDITTVVPMDRDSNNHVRSVVAVTMPIEDLRVLVAHAAGYSAKYSLSSMVGECESFKAMRDKAARVAKNKRNVLIQGESGTGKQRMAHGIHKASSRAAGPLISLHCADMTPEILEQELFGVTVSKDFSHQGKLELASKGTLFLDEVEKMPKAIAEKLAKVLQTGKVSRVGEEDVVRDINVRIIAACDSDLKRLTERGLFAQSLFEIVSGSIIRVPTLRSRHDDIPVLVKHITEELAGQHQMKPKVFLPETIELLQEYDWPGNIKQLQGVLEYAFFNTQEDVIKPEDISLMGELRPDSTWKEDKDVFIKAWKAAGGNVSRLSNLLNVSRVTLYRYLKKFGLDKEKR